MPRARDLDRLDLGSLHDYYAAGGAPREVIDVIYARIQENNAPNVWIHLASYDELRARAAALGAFDPSKPLWGVPFGVKDNVDVAGMPTTAACPAFAYMPERSAVVVERLLNAGALCVGKTNLDQFATGLVGTRSPYGPCRNVFDPRYLAGGSSSGSGVAVAAGQVSFAVGTDTAGSGRVPAALNNIVGLKPSRGWLSTEGVVPACRSLDSVSLFALSSSDAAQLRGVAAGRRVASHTGPVRSLGVPKASQLAFFGDEEAARLFESSLETLRSLGCEVHEIDWTPFEGLGELLYNGPFVAERLSAVGDFIERQPEACVPITREIILGAKRYTARHLWNALYELDRLRELANRVLQKVDGLVLPTTPTVFTLEEDAADPRGCNERLGTYTRFLNFLGWPALALPYGFRANGLPFGITLVGGPDADVEVDRLALRVEAHTGVGAGLARRVPPTRPAVAARAVTQPMPALGDRVQLAVVGAHLRGLALNSQLVQLGAHFVRETRTAPQYRLHVLPNTVPLKPGLRRVASDGACIAIEIWELTAENFGAFVAAIPPPLCIGSVQCEDGSTVKGFLCEEHALANAEDITASGGFRAYLSQRAC